MKRGRSEQWRRGRTAAFKPVGLTSRGMSQNNPRCFPTQIPQIIPQILFSAISEAEDAKFPFVSLWDESQASFVR